jgi:hypothetical protein
MNHIQKKILKRFIPGFIDNILPPGNKVFTSKTEFKPIKNREAHESHENYKHLQQKGDHFLHLSTMNFPSSIQKELRRRASSYMDHEVQKRKEHTETHHGGQSDDGHTHWEKMRDSLSKSLKKL